ATARVLADDPGSDRPEVALLPAVAVPPRPHRLRSRKRAEERYYCGKRKRVSVRTTINKGKTLQSFRIYFMHLSSFRGVPTQATGCPWVRGGVATTSKPTPSMGALTSAPSPPNQSVIRASTAPFSTR